MTMIERVARAIADHNGWDENELKEQWDDLIGQTRAAITAMREPTDEMKEKAWPVTDYVKYWKTMIDAALEEK